MGFYYLLHLAQSFLRLIHVVACNDSAVLFLVELPIFIQSFVEEHLGCFHFDHHFFVFQFFVWDHNQQCLGAIFNLVLEVNVFGGPYKARIELELPSCRTYC